MSKRGYRFGDWQVEPRINFLRLDDAIRTPEPKAMNVLCALLERAGEVVSTDELIDGRPIEPGSVYQRIGAIRHAIGDDARNPRYIETIARRGYRAKAIVAPASTNVAVLPFRDLSATQIFTGWQAG